MFAQRQTIGWWSGGVTSAVAIKLAMQKSDRVIPIYFETGSHHHDNERFLADCEQWYGTKILVIKNDKYKDVFDLIRKRRFINGPSGALCTTELKKYMRQALEKIMPYDAQVFGFEFEKKEIKRSQRFIEQYPDAKPVFPLIEQQLTKANCMYLLERAGIKRPVMYDLGYHNNNCIGCTKAGMGYWNKIREDFPHVFSEMATVEREVGRSCIKGTFLDELEPGRGNYPEEITPECGIFCPVEEFGGAK